MDEKTIITETGSNGWNSGIPLAFALNGNGWGWGNNGFGNGFFGGSGFGAGILGGILGGLIPGFFSGNWGGNWGNGNGAAAASLGAQATANNNTETILRAIDGSDSDIRLLATTLNSDVDSIRLAINTVNGAINTVGAQLGLTGQQIINALQQGDAAIASQICQCCCENKLLVTSQGYENQLRTLQQTDAIQGSIADLKTAMVKEFCDLKERDMQEKINSLTANNTLLRSQIDNANQTAALASLIAPVAKEVDDIKCKMPQTVPVTWPQLTAVNTTPYVSGGFYGNGFGYGFGGFGGNVVF